MTMCNKRSGLVSNGVEMTEPRAYRPLYIEYSTVGYILRYEKSVYDMTEQEFQTACMVHSNGYMHPIRALEVFQELRKEAGFTLQKKKP